MLKLLPVPLLLLLTACMPLPVAQPPTAPPLRTVKFMAG